MRPVGYALIFLVGFCAFGWYAVSLGCNLTFDVKNYHYYLPYSLLNDRVGFDVAPAQIQSFLNPVSFVPFYWAVQTLAPSQVGYLFGGLHGLSFGLLFTIAWVALRSMSRLPRFASSLACAVMGLTGPEFLWQLGTSFNDNLISLLSLLAVLILVRSLVTREDQDSLRPATLVVAGVLMGAATGLKLVFLVWNLAFAGGVMAVGRGLAPRVKALALFGVGSLVGLLITRGHWMGLLWSEYDSPLFPFYNKVFRSPLFYDTNWFDRRFLPDSTLEALQLPFGVSDGRFGLAVVVLLLATLAGAWRWQRTWVGPSPDRVYPTAVPSGEGRAGVFLGVTWILGLIIWESRFAIPRYTVFLEVLAPLVVVCTVRGLLGARFPVALAVLGTLAAIWTSTSGSRPSRAAWGEEYFGVTAPEFKNPEEVLVVIADSRPASFVVPFFQPEVKVVSVGANFLLPRKRFNNQSPPLLKEVLELIRSHRGDVFLLSTGRMETAMNHRIVPVRPKPNRRKRPARVERPPGPLSYQLTKGITLWRAEVLAPDAPLKGRP